MLKLSVFYALLYKVNADVALFRLFNSIRVINICNTY